MEEVLNLIDGQLKPAVDNKSVEHLSPVTHARLYSSPLSEPIDVVYAIKAANQSFVKWAETQENTRQSLLACIADKIDENRESLTRDLVLDQGMVWQTARDHEIAVAAEVFRSYAHKSAGPSSPIGTVGIISACCYPFFQLATQIAPALLAGNTVVCKPSSQTAMSAFRLAKLIIDCLEKLHLPGGVCNFVFGKGSEIGNFLVSHPAVSAISFSGRTETGKKVAASAQAQLKKVALFLSAKNSAIILDDADLTICAENLARACFEFQGQSPWAISRIMVPEKIQSNFFKIFQDAVSSLKSGDPLDPQNFVGPILNSESLQRVQRALEQAITEKGKVLIGASKESKQDYFQPTVVYDLHNCSPLQQEEIFGPLVLIVAVKYGHEAVKWANTTPFGLCTSIWSSNLERAQKLAAKLESGTIWINGWNPFSLKQAMKSLKSSGHHDRLGPAMLEFFQNKKEIILCE